MYVLDYISFSVVLMFPVGTGIPRPPYKLYRPAQTRFQHLPDHIKAHYEGPLSLTEIVPRQSWTPEGGGIVEECCKKACTLATLTSYCASPTVLPTMVEMSRLFSSEDSGMQADQAPPKPETTGEAPLQPQQVEDVDKEHNEVDRAGTRGSDGQEAHGSTSVGRLLSPATAFLRDPDEESAFGPRPRIGTFSRHRPYWYVVQAAFNDNVEDGA